jgi:hypothetical protein
LHPDSNKRQHEFSGDEQHRYAARLCGFFDRIGTLGVGVPPTFCDLRLRAY